MESEIRNRHFISFFTPQRFFVGPQFGNERLEMVQSSFLNSQKRPKMILKGQMYFLKRAKMI